MDLCIFVLKSFDANSAEIKSLAFSSSIEPYLT